MRQHKQACLCALVQEVVLLILILAHLLAPCKVGAAFKGGEGGELQVRGLGGEVGARGDRAEEGGRERGRCGACTCRARPW